MFMATNNKPVKIGFETNHKHKHTHIMHKIFQHAAQWGGSDNSASKFRILQWYMVPDLENMNILLKYIFVQYKRVRQLYKIL